MIKKTEKQTNTEGEKVKKSSSKHPHTLIPFDDVLNIIKNRNLYRHYTTTRQMMYKNPLKTTFFTTSDSWRS